MNVKQPTTAVIPDWERLFDELLQRQGHLMRVAATLRALGREPAEALDELSRLGTRLQYIEQMRRVTERADVSDAA